MEIVATSSLDLYHRMEKLEADVLNLRHASTATDSNARDLTAVVGEQSQQISNLNQATAVIRHQVRPPSAAVERLPSCHYFCLGNGLGPVDAY